VVGDGLALGQQLAAALAGSFCAAPPPLDLAPAHWDAVVGRLLDTGAGGLGWWRVRGSDRRTSPPSKQLQQAYRLHSLQAGMHEVQIPEVFKRCRAAGVEPLLAKGWAVARLYPEDGLRPYGDFDLFVRPDEYGAASALLAEFSGMGIAVDLHCGFPDLGDRTFAELRERSRLVGLGEGEVRILGPEDQLRHLCLHLLRHGAWRPLWLCDVAVALRSRPAEFDWNCFLKGDRRQADWLACVLGLAHQLLGVRIEDTPVARRAKRLPRWLAPSVLHQWGSSYTRYLDGPPLAAQLRRPSGLPRALRARWPNPIEATVSMNGSFTEAPRVFYQLGDCVVRTARFGMSLTRRKRGPAI
jgi:hypothetical protein